MTEEVSDQKVYELAQEINESLRVIAGALQILAIKVNPEDELDLWMNEQGNPCPYCHNHETHAIDCPMNDEA